MQCILKLLPLLLLLSPSDSIRLRILPLIFLVLFTTTRESSSSKQITWRYDLAVVVAGVYGLTARLDVDGNLREAMVLRDADASAIHY
jgi:hypothetical protein